MFKNCSKENPARTLGRRDLVRARLALGAHTRQPLHKKFCCHLNNISDRLLPLYFSAVKTCHPQWSRLSSVTRDTTSAGAAFPIFHKWRWSESNARPNGLSSDYHQPSLCCPTRTRTASFRPREGRMFSLAIKLSGYASHFGDWSCWEYLNRTGISSSKAMRANRYPNSHFFLLSHPELNRD